MGSVREGEKYMIRVDYMVVGPVSTNCYFLINEALREAVIVDPGENAKQIQGYLAENELKPVAILLTHGHFDHMMAASELRDAYGIKVYAAAKEKELLNSSALNLSKGFIFLDHFILFFNSHSFTDFNYIE